MNRKTKSIRVEKKRIGSKNFALRAVLRNTIGYTRNLNYREIKEKLNVKNWCFPSTCQSENSLK